LKYREKNTSNAGFLIMEVVVYLLIEIIFFGIVGYFVIFPIQEMFSILTERFIASEVVYKTTMVQIISTESFLVI